VGSVTGDSMDKEDLCGKPKGDTGVTLFLTRVSRIPFLSVSCNVGERWHSANEALFMFGNSDDEIRENPVPESGDVGKTPLVSEQGLGGLSSIW